MPRGVPIDHGINVIIEKRNGQHWHDGQHGLLDSMVDRIDPLACLWRPTQANRDWPPTGRLKIDPSPHRVGWL